MGLHKLAMKYKKKKLKQAEKRLKMEKEKAGVRKKIESVRMETHWAKKTAVKPKKAGSGFGGVMKKVSAEAAKWSPPAEKKKKKRMMYDPPPVRFGGSGRL